MYHTGYTCQKYNFKEIDFTLVMWLAQAATNELHNKLKENSSTKDLSL